MAEDYIALGLMSGTSLDGIDVGWVVTDGERILLKRGGSSYAYTAQERSRLAEYTDMARKWDFTGPPPNALAEASELVDRLHMQALERFFDETGQNPPTAQVIGYHGQTVLHDATRGRTLQLGGGQGLADAFGVPVVHDFRSADVKAGGQGAPLAPVYHRALVQDAELQGVTAVLNLGGVGNVTVVQGDTLLASDTGPANGPLDSWLSGVDEGGSVSAAGTPDFALVDAFLELPFFARDWPRSADRYDFDVLDRMGQLSQEDGAATLGLFTALSVKRTLRKMDVRPDRLVVCGGGRHNRTIMTLLSLEVGCEVLPAEALGWESDSIEAEAFAFMAVRVLEGLPNSFPTTTGVPTPTVGGRVAYPSSRRGSRGGE